VSEHSSSSELFVERHSNCTGQDSHWMFRDWYTDWDTYTIVTARGRYIYHWSWNGKDVFLV